MPKPRKMSLILGIIAGLVAIGAAIFQYMDKIDEKKRADKSEKEAKIYRKKFEDSIQTANSTLRAQNDTLSEITRLQEENRLLSKEITSLSKELYKYEAGDGSYPMIAVLGYATNAIDTRYSTEKVFEYVRLDFDLINNSRYPYKGVRIEIADIWTGMFYNNIRLNKNGVSNTPKHDNEKALDPNKVIEYGILSGNTRKEKVYYMPLPFPKDNRPEEIRLQVNWYGGTVEYVLLVSLDKDNKYPIVEYKRIIVNDKAVSTDNFKKAILDKYSFYKRYIKQ